MIKTPIASNDSVSIPYEELPFTNNFIFSKVLMNNPELCKELTEAILGVRIKEIISKPGREVSIEITEDGHGVRFDVMFEGNDAIYDIEMQTSKEVDIPKRSRYYQGMIDLSQLESGEHYTKLKKSYIIFINTFDLFGRGLPKYTFLNTCLESPGLQLGDDAIKIFVNAKGRSDKASPRLKELINYLECGTPTGSLSGKIDNEVNYARKNKEWRMQFMTYQQEIKFAADAAREEGLFEGTVNAIQKLLARFSPEEILEMGFTEDEIKAAQNS